MLKGKFVVYDTLSEEMHESDTLEEAESDLKEVIGDMIDQDAKGYSAYILEVKKKASVSYVAVYE